MATCTGNRATGTDKLPLDNTVQRYRKEEMSPSSQNSHHLRSQSSSEAWKEDTRPRSSRSESTRTTVGSYSPSPPFFQMMTRRSQLYSWIVLGLIHHGVRLAGAFPVTKPITIRRTSAPLSQDRLYLDHLRLSSQQFGQRHSQDRGSSSNPGPNQHGGDDEADGMSTRKPGWRRRVLSRLRRKRGSLKAKTALQEEEMTATSNPTHSLMKQNVDQFILENFEKLSPEQLFSTLEERNFVLDGSSSTSSPSPFFEDPMELPLDDPTIFDTKKNNMTDVSPLVMTLEEEEDNLPLDCVLPISLIGEDSSFEGGPPMRKVVRNWFQNLLTNCFEKWSAEPPVNLQVRCSPTGAILPALVRGRVHCNARVDFDRIVFDFIRLSGGSIEGSRLALNLLGFTVDRSGGDSVKNEQDSSSKGSTEEDPGITATTTKAKKTSGLLEKQKASPRYLTQFDLHANDCIFTQEDLFASRCVRNGLQNLVRRIMKGRGFATKAVVVTDISVLESGKISCKGEATAVGMIPYTKVNFEVRSGIAFKNRGHVLTFPGLELSLSPDAGFFVPIPNVELDIGHNARLRELKIDGHNQSVKLAASVTITPTHTRKLSHEFTQCGSAFASRFSYDVGNWLTRIGKFSL